MENISTHISYGEATKSRTATKNGIDNKPTDFQLKNMKLVANKCFEPLREHHGKAIFVSSFMRSKELNEHKSIRGSKTSQHMQGAYTEMEEGAIDVDADVFNNGITNAEIFHWLENNVEFDQLIWEYGNAEEPDWVHVSYRKGANRNMKLVVVRNSKGKPVYSVIK